MATQAELILPHCSVTSLCLIQPGFICYGLLVSAHACTLRSLFLIQQLFGCVYSAGSCYCLSIFLPCSCGAAALASGMLPGSRSMCGLFTAYRRLIGLAQSFQASLWQEQSVTQLLLRFLLFPPRSIDAVFPLPYLEWAEEILSKKHPMLPSLVPPSLPFLHTGSVRTEVKSCRAELPGCLPRALLVRRACFSPSPVSRSLFSCPFSPLLPRAK